MGRLVSAALVCGALLIAGPAAAAGPTLLSTKETQVYGGQRVKPGEAPWQVAFIQGTGVGVVEGVFCGGTLINDRWVLTAAHCFHPKGSCEQFSVTTFWVATGTVDIGSNDVALKRARRIVENPGFDCKGTLANDLALVELFNPVDFASNVRLPSAQDAATYLAPGSTVMASGWGLTETEQRSRVLLKVGIDMTTFAACQAHYGASLPAGSLCGGGGPKDTCTGDSGGPLWVGSGTQAVQLGIVSQGEPCGTSKAPGVYTPLLAHLKWIRETSKPVPCVEKNVNGGAC